MISYIPKIVCVKCDRVVPPLRMQSGNERWLKAICHGAEERVPFAAKDGEMVRLWEPEASK